jgi:hypothetical protein
MNYNWYEDRRIYLERELDDLEEQRAYLATDEAREVMIEVAIDSPFYNTLSAEDQTDYINNQIDADQDMFERQIQEMSGDLEVVRTVMSTWNESAPADGAEPVVLPFPAVGVDSSPRSVSTDSTFDEEGFDVGFINEYDENAFTRVPLSRTDATIERLIERPAPENSIEMSRDDVIMGPEIRLDESPEIIDLTTPSPPGSPERTPPPRTLRPPPAPSRPSRGRGGTKKTKGTKKKGKGKKRKSAKKRKGKSAKKTKKRK